MPGRVLVSEKTQNILMTRYKKAYYFEENKEIELPIFGETMLSSFVFNGMNEGFEV